MNGTSHATPDELDPQTDGDEALTDDALERVSRGAGQVYPNYSACPYCSAPIQRVRICLTAEEANRCDFF